MITPITVANKKIGLANKALPTCEKTLPKFLTAPPISPKTALRLPALLIVLDKLAADSETLSKSRLSRPCLIPPICNWACSN